MSEVHEGATRAPFAEQVAESVVQNLWRCAPILSVYVLRSQAVLGGQFGRLRLRKSAVRGAARLIAGGK